MTVHHLSIVEPWVVERPVPMPLLHASTVQEVGHTIIVITSSVLTITCRPLCAWRQDSSNVDQVTGSSTKGKVKDRGTARSCKVQARGGTVYKKGEEARLKGITKVKEEFQSSSLSASDLKPKITRVSAFSFPRDKRRRA